MNSYYDDDIRQLVSDYLRLIKERDMQRLLNLFTDDCVIYEPLGKGLLSHSNMVGKAYLNGKSEIESFLNIVMLADFNIKSNS
ncbi:MAG: hypothetical protein WBL67_09035 [Nitrososphaeraceae archaeon]